MLRFIEIPSHSPLYIKLAFVCDCLFCQGVDKKPHRPPTSSEHINVTTGTEYFLHVVASLFSFSDKYVLSGTSHLYPTSFLTIFQLAHSMVCHTCSMVASYRSVWFRFSEFLFISNYYIILKMWTRVRYFMSLHRNPSQIFKIINF